MLYQRGLQTSRLPPGRPSLDLTNFLFGFVLPSATNDGVPPLVKRLGPVSSLTAFRLDSTFGLLKPTSASLSLTDNRCDLPSAMISNQPTAFRCLAMIFPRRFSRSFSSSNRTCSVSARAASFQVSSATSRRAWTCLAGSTNLGLGLGAAMGVEELFLLRCDFDTKFFFL